MEKLSIALLIVLVLLVLNFIGGTLLGAVMVAFKVALTLLVIFVFYLFYVIIKIYEDND